MSDSTKNQEISKYWAFNQSGNIMVSSTVQEEKDLREEVVTEFQKVAVLYDAISTAIARRKKTYKTKDGEASLGLFDYGAISDIVASCGFFSLMHEEDRTFKSSSTSVSLDTQIITEMITALSGAGPVMNIAKQVISSMGGKSGKMNFSQESEKKSVRIGHLLFICEDVMGMPLINIQIISTSLDQLAWTNTTPCSTVARKQITMDYKMETFMFVDPQYMAKFSHEFKANDDFENLIKQMTGWIQDHGSSGKKG